jgi:putative endonuclease
MSAFVYMLRCADGSYYVGSARGETLDKRLGEHQSGELGGYTSTRRPVTLVYAEQCQYITDAIASERRIKGWSRAKKEALIRGDWDAVQRLAKRPGARSTGNATNPPPHPEVAAERPSKDAQHACVLRGSPEASTSA